MSATDELRDKCRTCRFLALPEGNISSGYCWQCDMPVKLMTYESFPKGYDPRCSDVHGEVFYCSDRWSLDRLTRCHWIYRQYLLTAKR